jgi:L-histidine Nalpha-methyltransferase
MRRLDSPQSGGPRPARTATAISVEAEAAALAELREALSRDPREIPCKYLYDDRGSALFEEITRLPEYYPTRTERALLVAQAEAIVDAAGGAKLAEMVELGSGAASKTVALLGAALRLGGKPRYVAVDISQHALLRTRKLLARAQPGIPVHEVLADYTQELKLPPVPGGAPRLALFLGGTIGNDEDEDAVRLLQRVRKNLARGDLLLLGANLVTDPAVIHRAYNDSAGVTAEFNRNILRNVNALTGSSFDPRDFQHYAPYVVDQRRIEMWLVAKNPLRVDLGRLSGTLELKRGEGIRTEISRRFTQAHIARLLDAAGFSAERWFESPDGRFGLALGRARATLRGL